MTTKPAADHPWKLRTAKQVSRAIQRKPRRASAEVDSFTVLLENEDHLPDEIIDDIDSDKWIDPE